MCLCNSPIVEGAVSMVKAVAGIDQVPADVLQVRREACRRCMFATRNLGLLNRPSKGLTTLSQCRVCGCFIAAKTRLASERCPIGTWETW